MGVFRVVVIFCVLLAPASIRSQPYFDPAGFSMWHIPGGILDQTSRETMGQVFLSLPFDPGKGNKLLISPAYNSRKISHDSGHVVHLRSTILPVTWLHYIGDSTWSFSITAIIRSNDVDFRFNGDVFQQGGAVLVNYSVNERLKLKAGLYFNREFYSDIYVPLAGIEWNINDRLKLFGLLPDEMRLERRFSRQFYAGLAFISMTNSYRIRGDGGYYKLFDNHPGIYADVVLYKRIVWNFEAGHTVFRSFKARNGGNFPEIDNDGLIIKSGLFYRVRLD